MRLTIETTNSVPEYSQKVVKEVPYDDLDIWAVQNLVMELLVGYGYAESSVRSILGFDSQDTDKSVHNREEEVENV